MSCSRLEATDHSTAQTPQHPQPKPQLPLREPLPAIVFRKSNQQPRPTKATNSLKTHLILDARFECGAPTVLGEICTSALAKGTGPPQPSLPSSLFHNHLPVARRVLANPSSSKCSMRAGRALAPPEGRGRSGGVPSARSKRSGMGSASISENIFRNFLPSLACRALLSFRISPPLHQHYGTLTNTLCRHLNIHFS